MFKQSLKIIKNFSFFLILSFIVNPQIAISEDFNKFSKVTFSINNVTSNTIIGYYEDYKSYPKKAFAKFNLNGEICEGSVIIQSKSYFNFECNSGYHAKGSYFSSSKDVNAMGKGKDSKGNDFIFRIHGNGTATKYSFLDSIKNLNNNVIASSKVKLNSNTSINADKKVTDYSDYVICLRTKWREGYLPYQGEAKRRGLDCGFANGHLVTTISKSNNTSPYTSKTGYSISNLDNDRVCFMSTENYKWSKKSHLQVYIQLAKRRGLDCGVGTSNKTVIASKPETKTYTQPKSTISSAELNASKREAKQLRKKLAALENKQKQEQQRIDTDTRVPLLEIISNKTKGKRGTITGIARDNIEVAEVTVDGKPVQLSSNGNFKYSTFVPSDGLTLNVQVTDVAGLTSSRSVALQRNDSIASTSITFDRLNPLGKSVRINSNALALIVGVEGYKNTNADAIYADKDAKMFRDYATEKLGIPENRIKTLLNDKAEYAEILLTTKDWLRRASKANKSDIYIFFAGHGLASDDGKNMYLLPYDGRPRLLDKTALLRDELFKEIQQSNPRSVTVFLDTCYSGTTRGTDMLVASRPIM
ncbi:caspase family protein, partial [Pseudomonadota bacterium]|nr:caspase family protein [Pseudomonadota bacterium]